MEPELYEFKQPLNKNIIIEKFLFEKCNRAPSYRVKIMDLFDEFKTYYESITNETFNYVIKEKIKNCV